MSRAPQPRMMREAPGPFQGSAEYAALREKVYSAERDLSGLRSSVDNLGVKFEQSMTLMNGRFEAGLQTLNTKFDERARTPWGQIFMGLGFVLSFCLAIGAIAYAPIQQGLADARASAWQQTELSRATDLRQWEQIQALRTAVDYAKGYDAGRKSISATP